MGTDSENISPYFFIHFVNNAGRFPRSKVRPEPTSGKPHNPGGNLKIIDLHSKKNKSLNEYYNIATDS